MQQTLTHGIVVNQRDPTCPTDRSLLTLLECLNSFISSRKSRSDETLKADDNTGGDVQRETIDIEKKDI